MYEHCFIQDMPIYNDLQQFTKIESYKNNVENLTLNDSYEYHNDFLRNKKTYKMLKFDKLCDEYTIFNIPYENKKTVYNEFNYDRLNDLSYYTIETIDEIYFDNFNERLSCKNYDLNDLSTDCIYLKLNKRNTRKIDEYDISQLLNFYIKIKIYNNISLFPLSLSLLFSDITNRYFMNEDENELLLNITFDKFYNNVMTSFDLKKITITLIDKSDINIYDDFEFQLCFKTFDCSNFKKNRDDIFDVFKLNYFNNTCNVCNIITYNNLFKNNTSVDMKHQYMNIDYFIFVYEETNDIEIDNIEIIFDLNFDNEDRVYQSCNFDDTYFIKHEFMNITYIILKFAHDNNNNLKKLSNYMINKKINNHNIYTLILFNNKLNIKLKMSETNDNIEKKISCIFLSKNNVYDIEKSKKVAIKSTTKLINSNDKTDNFLSFDK